MKKESGFVPNSRHAQFLAANTGPHTPATWFRSLPSDGPAAIHVRLGQEISACNQQAPEALAEVQAVEMKEEELTIVEVTLQHADRELHPS